MILLKEVSAVWFEVLAGTVLVGGSVICLRGFYSWYIYHNSIQSVIYSDFLEYSLRKRSIRGLSESYYFKSRFGEHRIIYQLVNKKKESKPQAFVFIILSSGLFLINVKAQRGNIIAKQAGDYKVEMTEKNRKTNISNVRIVPFKNPNDELIQCKKMVDDKLGSYHPPIYLITVFPNKSNIHWEGKQEDVRVIRRKELIETIKKLHDINPNMITTEKIQQIYMTVAADSINYERNSK